MAQAPVTADVAEPGDVLGRLPPQLAFHNEVLVQQRCQPR
jgi:hypothetical protein